MIFAYTDACIYNKYLEAGVDEFLLKAVHVCYMCNIHSKYLFTVYV